MKGSKTRHPVMEVAQERLWARSIANIEEGFAALTAGEESDRVLWGYLLTASRARLLSASLSLWREAVTASPFLQELRVFDGAVDFHWLGERGVVQSVDGETNDGEGTGDPVVAPEGWLQRDRRSRLWGEWLRGTELWYEAGIPDPIAYEGLSPGPEQRFVFLRYREYICHGRAKYIRYLDIEGGADDLDQG